MTRSMLSSIVIGACLHAACAPLEDEQSEELLATAQQAFTGTEDMLNSCSPSPSSFYRLPFGPGSGFTLDQGNWDDPGAKHTASDGQAQSYSYDFLAPVGTEVRAARAGRVAFVHSAQSINTTVPYTAPGDPDLERGEGNLVVIRHLDDTAAAYAHLQQDQVFVREGEYVPRGRVIALSGNTGHSFAPHLHFDVHPSFTDWDSWVNTMKIRFQDANHTCWRPLVGNSLASNNTVTSVPLSALMQPGTGTQSFLAGMELDDFLAAWVDLGTSSPAQYMKDFDTYLEGGVRRYAGVFGPGSAGQSFFPGLTYQQLRDKRTELANAPTKQVMITFDTYMDGSTRRFDALFGPGTADQDFKGGLTQSDFVDEWIAQGLLGRDMITFQVYPSGGQMRYAGLFGTGNLGQHFVSNKTYQQFYDLWIALGQQSPPAYMRAFRIYNEGGQTRYAGLFGPGQGGQGFHPGRTFDTLASEWTTAQKVYNAGLVTVVTTAE
ncbi:MULTISPECIES: M23 family metallopeptidase [Sorangium]|uniref:M23ase beta-sheet core domain-containing protein n=1 Tax=Sorangium cellulosum TaxID=56 RepID=A0A4P2QZN7_SORCE|nr:MULTISPECIES: M23 family metallopeptidase [Sorangium]AUX36094.1 uncharacterized protein SOCE836_083000 [Sorangium cellulosum]WCQ95398.1 endolysin [Sorangium sp. Soce836]